MPVDKIKNSLKDENINEADLAAFINELDPFEIARRLNEFSTEDKVRIFHLLNDDSKRQVLLYETDMDSRMEIQETLDKNYLANLLDEMAEDEATDIIQELSDETQEEILSKMEKQDAEVIKDLIQYGEETAGGLMTPEFNKVSWNQPAAEIFTKVRQESSSDTQPYFYVVDNQDKLLGFFKLRDLLNAPASASAKEFIRPETPKVDINDPCEKVANVMSQEHLSILPVVDEENVIHGVVTFDDVIRVMEDIASEDIYTMVGTAKVDPFAKKTGSKIIARAPWLFTTFIGGIISAWVLGAFDSTLTEFAAIVLFIPFVIGLAGNVGIQGATVIVRGLATGDIQEDNIAHIVKNEILVGILNGTIFGVLCGTLIGLTGEVLLKADPLLGVVVGTGIILAVSLASLVGSLTPILFINLDIDPAISTGPIITVANDILGLAVYLVTAKIILSAF
ncbi:MAG: magnesium transporter [Nitrospinae bacterium]|nr:magnesium transporter [Nitrospinota bacterium]